MEIIIMSIALLAFVVTISIFLWKLSKRKPTFVADFITAQGVAVSLSCNSAFLSVENFNTWIDEIVKLWLVKFPEGKKKIDKKLNGSKISIVDTDFIDLLGLKAAGYWDSGRSMAVITVPPLLKDKILITRRTRSLLRHEFSHAIVGLFASIDESEQHNLFKKLGVD